MATSQLFTHNSNVLLPRVQLPTITQFEKTAPSNQVLYKKLFAENQELALWIRHRAEQSYTDLEDREVAVSLALEALAILDNQTIINGLHPLFESDTADEKIAES